MSQSKKTPATIDDMMERASEALAKASYFECERLAAEALEWAHASGDYDRMARILMPLQEARRQKRDQAIDSGNLVVLERMILEEEELEPGVYLVQPPLVGADGRDLRERGDRDEVPVFSVVREPTTTLGLIPIVMIGPITVRARIKPPKSEDEPDLAWIISASEALGDAAMASMGEDLSPAAEVDGLYDRLRTCVEHEKLHQRLAEACKRAAQAEAAGGEGAGPRKASSSRARSRRAG